MTFDVNKMYYKLLGVLGFKQETSGSSHNYHGEPAYASAVQLGVPHIIL